ARTRKIESERRRSSLTHLDVLGLKNEAKKLKQDIREVKSDLVYRSKELATDQDITAVKKLKMGSPAFGVKDVEQTPAPSPKLQAQKNNNNNDGDGNDDAGDDDDDDDEDWKHTEEYGNYNNQNVGVPNEFGNGSDEEEQDEHPGPLLSVQHGTSSFRHRESKITIEELQSMFDGKTQLVQDLQRQMETLRQSRQTEIYTLQNGLKQMIEQCRLWWQKLLQRYQQLEKRIPSVQ
ncbi:nucleolar transcription factor 1-A, partial [Reticulomyxa filosa]